MEPKAFKTTASFTATNNGLTHKTGQQCCERSVDSGEFSAYSFIYIRQGLPKSLQAHVTEQTD